MKPERIMPFNRWEVENGDFFLIMRKLAAKKEVQVTAAITGPTGSRWLRRVSVSLILGVVVMVLIGFIRLAVK
ncbi:MAG: hypothetical protein ACHQYP_05960 [Nitrospiria bacterium]